MSLVADGPDTGQRAARDRAVRGPRARRRDLPGQDDDQVVVGDQRQRAAAPGRAVVEDDRAGLGDRGGAAGDGAASPSSDAGSGSSHERRPRPRPATPRAGRPARRRRRDRAEQPLRDRLRHPVRGHREDGRAVVGGPLGEQVERPPPTARRCGGAGTPGRCGRRRRRPRRQRGAGRSRRPCGGSPRARSPAPPFATALAVALLSGAASSSRPPPVRAHQARNDSGGGAGASRVSVQALSGPGRRRIRPPRATTRRLADAARCASASRVGERSVHPAAVIATRSRGWRGPVLTARARRWTSTSGMSIATGHAS